MTTEEQRTPTVWIHAIAMAPLPFIVLMAVRGSVAVLAGPRAQPLALRDPRETVLALAGALVPLACAALTWAPSRSARGVGYLGYSIALSTAFAVGVALPVVDMAQPASAGRIGVLSWALLIGSFLSGACLLAVAHLIVTDWRGSRREADLGGR